MGDSKILESNVIVSFTKAKNDVVMLKSALSQQNDTIRQIYENQKALLVRIKNLEKRYDEKKEKVLEKRIVIASSMKAPKVSQFIGSEASRKLHDPVCPFAKNIKPKNKMVFKTKAKAFNMGYKACDCMKKV
jgi:hypothetical protein